jgi:polar amino acid transport system substrate-binding protein
MRMHAAKLLLPLRGIVVGTFLLAVPLGSAAVEGVVDAARAALPEQVRSSGVLKVATSLQWPPFAYKAESGEATGIDIRLVSLLAGKLGLKADFDDIKFPAIVPGVSNGRYDAGVDEIAITSERLKVADLVPYYKANLGLLIQKGRKDMDAGNLCGHTIALTQGSMQVSLTEQLSAKCVAAGKEQIKSLFFPDSADTYLAVANGRGDGFLSDIAVGLYTAKTNAKLEVAPGIVPSSANVSGIVVKKSNGELYHALQLALESALQDGSYGALLKEYGVEAGTLTIDQIRNPPKD